MYETSQSSVNESPFQEKFSEFFRHRYLKPIERLAQKYPEKKSLIIDFKELEHFDYELADELLKNPDACLEAAYEAIAEIDIPMLDSKEFKPHLRFFNLPGEKSPILRDLSAEHIGKLITIEGVVRQVTEVLPKMHLATWRCARCDATYKIIQQKNFTKSPNFCSECKQKAFELLEEKSEFVDYQKIQVQEPLEYLKGSEQATNLNIYVSDDLVNMVSPGDRAKVTGILRLNPPKEKKVVYERYLEAVYVEETAREFEEVEISKEEAEDIKKLAARDDVYDMLIQSIAPHIYGHEVMKESIALQLFGGVKKTLPNDQHVRGNIHVLLVGDPGMAKSAVLKATDSIAPKSIYVAGKTSSGAGISATAVKDEFGEGGWTLKAGALVLASGGMAMIDEFDKMEAEDRSAMHEAMEQQSYHKDFEIMLADGSAKKIGELVDNLIEENRHSVIQGKDCEILPTNELDLVTTDFSKTFTIKADRVSRHKAPEHFIKITYSNGRKITVTPEHPVFTYGKHGFLEIPAENAKAGMHAPGVKNYSTTKNRFLLDLNVTKGHKKVALPAEMNTTVGKLLGYVASEGHSYASQANRYAEIGISNTDPAILHDMESCFANSFRTRLNKNVALACDRENATKDLTTIRATSKEIYSFFDKNFSELMAKAPLKRAPNKIKAGGSEIILEFLRASFSGDGFVDDERFGYRTASYGLACDYQDLLLSQGICSYIETEKGGYHKVVVSGTENMEKFSRIAEPFDHRKGRIDRLIKRSHKRESSRDLLPNPIAVEINSILKELRISDGYFVNHIKNNYDIEAQTARHYLKKAQKKLEMIPKSLENGTPRKIRKSAKISLGEIATKMKLSSSMITYIERNNSKSKEQLIEIIKIAARQKYENIFRQIQSLERIINSDLKFLKIKKVEKIKNTDSAWVYDVTVEPTHTFVSCGLVLHNTISVAKAGIVTKFKSETSILAAANPKYSRFDLYRPFIEQIDLPASLISRFDLFFMIRDVLDRTKDSEIAMHILKTHRAGEMMLQRAKKGLGADTEELTQMKEQITPKISGELLKKYISYARQNIFPVLTETSQKELSEFYVGLRDQGRKEGAYSATHRQLEGLIRLSEASARVRLSDVVERQDVERSIRLVKTSLQDLVTDPETGKIDIDIITSGQTHTMLTNLKKILGIVREKAQELDMVPIEEIISEGKAQGIEADKVRDLLNKLQEKGDVYTPRHGFYKPTAKQ